MKYYGALLGSALLAFGALSGCSLFGPNVTLSSRPAIPKPSCYSCHVPDMSSIMVLKTKPMALPFTPDVSQVVYNGQTAYTDITPQLVKLTDSSGNIIKSPVLANPPSSQTSSDQLQPLQTQPLMQIVDFWRKVGTTQRYAAGTSVSYTTSETTGTTTTSTNSMNVTVGASATGGIGAFSATVSTQFSDTWTNSVQVSSSQTSSKTFTATPSQTKSMVYVVWQLVYEVRIVRKATAAEIAAGTDGGTGYVPYNDPNYTFIDPQTGAAYVDPITGKTISGIAPVVLPQTTTVPSSTFF